MSEVAEHASTELVDDNATFFAPAATDLIDSLIGRYQSERNRVEQVHKVIMTDEFRGAVGYFLDGNSTPDRHYSAMSVEKMFALDGAVFALHARYWGETLALTDVYECMPQARRDLWNAQLKGERSIGSSSYNRVEVPRLPDFEEGTVRSTIGTLLRERALYMAERVDGIFNGLSSEHLTNVPEGFGKRMIMGYMLSYGSIRHEKSGLIHDLRAVIAKFMGRDAPRYNTSDVLLRDLYGNTGQWVTVDGGALRIRCYKKGTAHMEVHPDIAWRLNQILAELHPRAIPAEFRTRPKKKAKEFPMMGRPLPFATLELLAEGLPSRKAGSEPNKFKFAYEAKKNKVAFEEACSVLAALGGTPDPSDVFPVYAFDYPVHEVLKEVVLTGCLPDQKAHQYYPTPEKLAKLAVGLADIGPDTVCLEPSAGQGGIADHMPKDRTTCIEISPLHCAVLKAKGFKTIECDFIIYADMEPFRADFDVVVMNPPFSDGRAKLHVEFASHKVKVGGRLVAILPVSFKGKKFLGSGFDVSYTEIYDREFAGTSVSVVIMKAVRLS